MTALDLVASPVRGIARNTFRESLGSAPALDYLENRLFVSNTPRLDGKIYGEQPGRGTQRDMQPGRCVVGAGSAYIAGPTGLITTGDFSLSFWVYEPSLAATRYLWGMGNPSTASGSGVTASVSTGGQLSVVINDGDASGTTISSASGAIVAATWTHVAVVFDRDGNAQIYVDGSASGSAVSLSGKTSTIANGAFHLLRHGSATNYGTCRIFDFRAYNRLLTATEIYQLYTLAADALPNATADLLWHYKLDDTHPTIAWDSSGNDRHGTKTTWVVGTNDHSGSDVPWSWQNERGYTYSDGATYYQNDDGTGLISSGSYLPRLESDKTKCIAYLSDGTRAALQYTGKCPGNGLFDQNNAGTFNGSSYYVDVGNVSASLKTIEFWCKPDSITSRTDYVIDLNGTDYITIVNGTVTKNGFSGATVTIYVNGVVSSTIPNITEPHHVAIVSDTGFSASDFDIGRLEGTGWYDGLLFGVRVFTDELTAAEVLGEYNRTAATLDNCAGYWPICEGGGTVVHNVASVGLNGTATSISEPTFWGTKQSKFNYTGSHGHTLLTHATSLAIRVPYLVSRVPNTYAIPSGYSKVDDHPATTGHNNCESSIDMKGGVAYPTKRWDRPVNVATKSESLDGWTFTRGSAVPNSVEAPDGTMSADKFILDTTSATDHRAFHPASVALAGQVVTASMYFKAGEVTWVTMYDSIAVKGKYFDLTNGVMGSATFGGVPTNATITAVPNKPGWWRCSITYTAGASTTVGIYLAEGDGDATFATANGSDGLYAWGLQIEKGTTPGEYTPSDWSDDPPRFAMPNEMLSYRSEFDNAYWTRNGSITAVTANAIADSDGNILADKFYGLGVGGEKLLRANFSWVANQWYLIRIEAKPAELSWFQIRALCHASNERVWFDIANGKVGTIQSNISNAWMVSKGNGWYECNALVKAPASISNTLLDYYFNSGDNQFGWTGTNGEGVYIAKASCKPWTNPNPNYFRLTTKNGVPWKADRITRYDRVLIGSRNDAAETYTQDVAL